MIDPALACSLAAGLNSGDGSGLLKAVPLLPGLPYGSSETARAVWVKELQAARDACHFGFNSSVYDRSDLKWTQTSYVSPQMHAFDRFFYQPGKGFTVSRWLEDTQTRYGGVDSLLLWPTYPNLGIDSRNQFDMFRSMPGGLDALKTAVAELHANGVRVLIPYNPWDNSTHRENTTNAQALAHLARTIGADGFNGDTMWFVGHQFFEGEGDGLAIEPEGMGIPQMRDYHTLGWAYWKLDPDSTVPRVDFIKYALDSRWMSHGCERWSTDHARFILTAYFNGVGFVSWENVWGT
jgi:gamma-glutamyl hercynylcysteine S-oxide synthase